MKDVKKVNFRLDKETIKKIDFLVLQKKYKSRSDFIRSTVEEFLEKKGCS